MSCRSALSAAILLVLTVGQADATEYCTPAKTRDGFVALRSGPSAAARLVARMTPADDIRPTEETRGGWVKVEFWRDSRFDAKGDPRRYDLTGWMNARLIAEDSCG